MALFYDYDKTRLDYYTYGPFSGTTSPANSGVTAAITGLNTDCDFAYLDLTGIQLRHRRYNNIYPQDYPSEVTRDTSDISQYNSGFFGGILISPQHVLIANHVHSYFENIDWTGLGTNILEFKNYSTGVGVTAELDVSTLEGIDDLGVYKLKDPITDSNIRIYDKMLLSDGSAFIPDGTLIYYLTSNGIIAWGYAGGAGGANIASLNMGYRLPQDDIYNQWIAFSGDSSSGVLVESESLGTILCGVASGAPIKGGLQPGYILNDTINKDWLDDLLAEDGYSIDWVSPSDLYTLDKYITMATGQNYVPTTNMNAKNIKCEVTAIRGALEDKKFGDTFIAVSGEGPPSLGFTGQHTISDIYLYNSFRENTTLWWTIEGNDDWTDTFPPVTRWMDIKIGNTGPTGGESAGIAVSPVMIGGFEIPTGVSGAAGSTLYYSTWLENLFGSTGNTNEYYELGTVLEEGFGPTFSSFAFDDYTPTANQTIIGTATGWTAMPDRGNSNWAAVGLGFVMDPIEATFEGATFGITIPSDAEAGDSLGILYVRYVNTYNTVLAQGLTYLKIT